MAEACKNKFYYVYSCDLDVNVQIKIGTLEGKRERPCYRELVKDPMLRYSGVYREDCCDLFVTCQVFCDGKALTLPISTSYKAFSKRWNWNEWLTLPIKYSDMPRNAQIGLTIWDIYGTEKTIAVGGTTLPAFGKNGTFGKGMVDLKVWPNVECHGNSVSTTSGKVSDESLDEMSRLTQLSKKYHEGHMIKMDWLDRLTFREIHVINEQHKRESNFMYLTIEFARIHFDETDYAIVYYEENGDEVFNYRTQAEIVTVPDPEIHMENLVESKHHKLARSLRSGPSDKDLKPNAANRDQLNTIVSHPPNKTLTNEEQDLVWKFRFYLSSQKKALTKFLKCVNWSLEGETKQALDLLIKWSPIDPEDALELLSPLYTHPVVRRYAVARLRQADDEDLLLYLLQLVQALKYEDFDKIQTDWKMMANEQQAVLSLSSRRESATSSANTSIHDDNLHSKESVDGMVDSELKDVLDELIGPTTLTLSRSISHIDDMETDLATFLIERAAENFNLANYLYWYLSVEIDDQQEMSNRDDRIKTLYLTVMKRFSTALHTMGAKYMRRRSLILAEKGFVERLITLVKMVSRESGNRKKKAEKLQALLSNPEVLRFNFANFEPIPLVLDPEVMIKSINSEKASLFKSALMPCKLTFETVSGGEYVSIFKHGDDLRQDQLILQMIELMDKLLRRENLDLKLTPYKVLATGPKHGLVQFIESQPIAEILTTEQSIHNYLRKYAPCDQGPYGIQADVLDNYVKSCAGYCVITYLLGVGDRHLDNLMLTKSGRLFHIDFGYILGRDPKPMPPPMKLSKEMVEAMGGNSSEHFSQFKKLCYTAFLHLRRSSNLILNLFSLMVDANIPDIALEPDKSVKKVQDKFLLELSDEEAVHYIQNIIDVSVSAVMAAVVEQFHKLAQYMRK